MTDQSPFLCYKQDGQKNWSALRKKIYRWWHRPKYFIKVYAPDGFLINFDRITVSKKGAADSWTEFQKLNFRCFIEGDGDGGSINIDVMEFK